MLCTRCKFHKNNRHMNCMKFIGSEAPKLVVMKDYIAKAEEEEGEFFVGDIGFKFNQLLESAGFTRDDVLIGATMKCYQKQGVVPTKREINSCFIYTYNKLQEVNQDLIIAMGTSTLYALTGETSINNWRGKLVFSKQLNCNVYCTSSLQETLYNEEKWFELVKDFKNIPNIIGSKPREIKHTDYILVDTNKKFSNMFHSLYNNPIAFDVETTGLNPKEELIGLFEQDVKIRTIQLGKSQDEIYILPKFILDGYDNYEKFSELLYTSPLMGQTFDFDVRWIFTKYNIFPENWLHDTCLAEYLISGVDGNDLTSLTAKYNPSMLGYDSEVHKLGGAHNIRDPELLYQYGADDIATLFPIMRQQYKKLAKKDMLYLFNDIIMPCNKVLTRMSLRGVTYDIPKLLKVDTVYEEKSKGLLEQALLLPGIKETEDHFKQLFNPRSYNHVKYLLIDYYQLPVLKETNKGAPSIGEDEMKLYSGKNFKNPYCELMSEYRSIETLRSNFISGAVAKLVDNVAHTTYSLHATTTGRPNSRNPNLLNLPQVDEIKRSIIPRDGHKFLYADLGQIEVRLAAVLYNDPNLLEVCNGGGDFHSMIASKIANMDYEVFYQGYLDEDPIITDIRTRAKSVTFGVLYQQAAPALAYALGISVKAAQEFIDEYFQTYPDLERNIELHKKFVIENGYAKTYFNFFRRWEDHTEENHNMLRECVNMPIQGTAWNIMELILIEVDKRLLESFKARLMMQIYDSMIVETPDDEIQEVGKMLKDVVENINKPYEDLNKVKLITDIKVGNSLCEGDMKKLEV